MQASKAISAVFGTLTALLALGLIAGGGALTWAFGTQRSADGFLMSPEYAIESSGYAITSTEVDLATRPGDWWPTNLADVQFTIDSAEPVFVGIGPVAEVDRYLGTVARHEVTQLGAEGTDVDTQYLDGGAPAGLPGSETFWVASSEGAPTETLTWEVAPGTWSVVVMNADASEGVDIALEAGARIPVLLGIGIGLLVGGLLLAMAAAALLVWATRPDRDATGEAIRPSAFAPAGAYPVVVEGHLDPQLSRWMWLVKWFLAIPHFVVLFFLWIGFAFATVTAFFSILFTGRYPRGLFDYNVGVMRWMWRVEFYALTALGTDQYPPFTLADVDYPARFQVEYPEKLSPALVVVKWWLLAIPHYIIVGLFTSGLIWWTTDIGDDRVLEVGGGLIGILVLVAALALGFTGRYPQGLFDLVIGLNRWVYRVMAYAALMRDEYPPFRLDLGGEDPGSRGPDRPSQPPTGTATPPELVDIGTSTTR